MNRNHRPLWLFAGLAAFCGVLFFPFLGARDLIHSHEARAAQNAQMILDEGHWLVPRLFDHHLELQKPPLYYWLVAVLGWLQGGRVEAWAVRLPAALSASACVLFLFLLGIRAKRPLAGFLAAVILASCVHFTWLAQVGRIDMPLTMTITFALGAFYLGGVEKPRLWHAFAYVSLGIGLLLKGPIALVLPGVVLGAACVRSWRAGSGSDRSESRLARGSSTLWWGVPLTLAIAAPLYLWANLHTDNQLWDVFFWYHNVERGLGGSEALAAHPWWFYGPRAAVDLLPWSLAVPIAICWFLRNPELRQDDAACLGLIWFLAITTFLSLMRFKRADYLLPAYPGVAFFLGACAERWWRSVCESEAQARAWAPALACASGSVIILYAAGWLIYGATSVGNHDALPYRTMAADIRARTEKPVVFFRAESHLLAYHLGQPVTTIREWENLEIWAARPFPVYFVMPEASAREWRKQLPDGSLEEVLRTSAFVGGKRARPLVVLRSRGNASTMRP